MIYQKQFWNVDVDVETIHLTLECGGDHHHHFGPNYSGILLGQIQCIFGLYRTLLINIWHSNQLNSTLRDMWDFSRIGGMHKLIQHTTFNICCLFLLSSVVCPENALMQLIAMRTEPNYPCMSCHPAIIYQMQELFTLCAFQGGRHSRNWCYWGRVGG